MSFDKHISKYEPILFEDSRGYLKVISEDSNLGISYKESFSKSGVFRGMHIQVPPYEQTKHICVLEGTIIDYVIILDKENQDFGKTFSQEIKASEKVYTIPKYCAHGFYAKEDTILRYLCIGKYSEVNEICIKECYVESDNLIISSKDKSGTRLENCINTFKEIDWEKI